MNPDTCMRRALARSELPCARSDHAAFVDCARLMSPLSCHRRCCVRSCRVSELEPSRLPVDLFEVQKKPSTACRSGEVQQVAYVLVFECCGCVTRNLVAVLSCVDATHHAHPVGRGNTSASRAPSSNCSLCRLSPSSRRVATNGVLLFLVHSTQARFAIRFPVLGCQQSFPRTHVYTTTV